VTFDLSTLDSTAVLDAIPGEHGLVVVSGSTAYGLATPDSDIDYRGFYLAPARARLGLTAPDPNWSDPSSDCTLAELDHFVRNAIGGNPHYIESLANPLVVVTSPVAEALRAEVAAFATTKYHGLLLRFARDQYAAALSFRSKGRPVAAAKPARHAFRLLEMADHLAATGEIRLRVADRDAIFALGELTGSDLEFESAYAHAQAVTVDLPPSVLDEDRINDIVVDHRFAQVRSAA
jgi:hypothetical protein